MTKVLMVCLGNICRSPLAEGILKSKLNPDMQVEVDSAGTGSYHVGELPDPRSIDIAIQHGIDITDQRARQFTRVDFDRFDWIYVMDSSNYHNVVKLAQHEADRTKVKRILDELPHQAITDVPDPYYGGQDGFKNVYNLLDDACNVIVDKLR